MDKDGLEIERKFLAEKYKKPIPGEMILDITQTYLIRKSPGIQRRIRRIASSDNKLSYFYTEKRFVSPSVREEKEWEIPEKDYLRLNNEKDNSLTQIFKKRRVFEYMSQRFEMDEYDFSDKYTTLELELENESQQIVFPPFITIIKEVTGDSRYSNAALARARKIEL